MTSISFSKELVIFQHLTNEVVVLQWPFESKISVSVSNESDELLNDTPTSSPSPLTEIQVFMELHTCLPYEAYVCVCEYMYDVNIWDS